MRKGMRRKRRSKRRKSRRKNKMKRKRRNFNLLTGRMMHTYNKICGDGFERR